MTSLIYKAKYFGLHEFECPCCLNNEVDHNLVIKLDQAREIADTGFRINSGWRCQKHNSEVGGKETSSHLYGFAADIKAEHSRTRYQILNGLITAGFNRIGIAKTFIHADIDSTKDPEVTWLY